MTHYQILQAALEHGCICEGRAIPAWEQILTLNGIDVAAYCASIDSLFRHGGGKDLNHFYVGPPSSGKTALTRPVLALFGATAFAKPQSPTTFALAGLVGAKAVVWNDFYWPHPPLSWGDLLNVLDNEGFGIGVPKGDGQTDYAWNQKGDENVIAILTSNKEVVYVSDHSVDEVKTAAWRERFGNNILHFRARLPSPDRRYKVWLKCTRCYAQWILGRPAGGGGDRPAEGEEEEAPEDDDMFGFGGSLDQDDDEPSGPAAPSSSAGVALESPLTPQQLEIVQRNRAAAVARRAAAGAAGAPAQPTQGAPPATPFRGTSVADPDRSRSAHGSAAAATPVSAVELPPVPLLPFATPGGCALAPAEPVRELNLFLQRHNMEPARYDACMEDATHGLWHCQASAGGVSARGTGRGKAAAKREATKELLRAMRELAAGSGRA